MPPTFRPVEAPRAFVVVNQKGGAGKTTSTVELAAAWAAAGLRVRVIDADHQEAALSAWLLPQYPEGAPRRVAGPPERRWVARALAADDAVRWDRLLFSAKECVYKAWYPLTGRFLAFKKMRLRPAGEGMPAARLSVPGPVADGRRITGFRIRWAARDVC